MRKRVANEQPLCPDCKKAGKTTAWYPAGELDHIIPVTKDGSNDRTNLEGVCLDHHKARTAATFGHREWKPNRGVDADGWPIEG